MPPGRRGLLLLALALVACRAAPPDAQAPVVPAAVLVEPAVLALRAGESGQLSAQANDALGQPIGGAPLTFETREPGLLRVTGNGLVSSVGSTGTAHVDVSSGSTRASVVVTVTPAAASKLERVGGGALSGPVGTALPARVSFRSVDAFGNPVAGERLRFSALDGGGAEPLEAVTDAAGEAGTSWTLGPTQGVQRLSVALDGAREVAELVTAAARPGRPGRLAPVPDRSPPPSAGAEAVLRVRVADDHDNPVPGVEVAWTLVEGKGAIAARAGTTNAAGIAEALLSTDVKAGSCVVAATAAGVPQPLRLTVATVAGPAARLVVVRGDHQRAPAGGRLRVKPAVRVEDRHGNAVAGVPVRFEVTAGEGAVEHAAPLTDASGVASCGTWTLGAAGPNTLRAAAGDAAPPVELSATGLRR